MTIMAATKWPKNAHMIADVARLGYLHEDIITLDMTYGRGTWWKKFRPTILVANGTDLEHKPDLTADFRAMPFRDGAFSQIIFDPPYVVKGGRRTSTMEDHQDRYGMTDAPTNPLEGQQLVNDGLAESARLLETNGVLLVKAQDYVSSGRVHWGVDETTIFSRALGLRKVDQFLFLNNGSAQDKARTKRCATCSGEGCIVCDNSGSIPVAQQHARRNVSVLMVFQHERARPLIR